MTESYTRKKNAGPFNSDFRQIITVVDELIDIGDSGCGEDEPCSVSPENGENEQQPTVCQPHQHDGTSVDHTTAPPEDDSKARRHRSESLSANAIHAESARASSEADSGVERDDVQSDGEQHNDPGPVHRIRAILNKNGVTTYELQFVGIEHHGYYGPHTKTSLVEQGISPEFLAAAKRLNDAAFPKDNAGLMYPWTAKFGYKIPVGARCRTKRFDADTHTGSQPPACLSTPNLTVQYQASGKHCVPNAIANAAGVAVDEDALACLKKSAGDRMQLSDCADLIRKGLFATALFPGYSVILAKKGTTRSGLCNNTGDFDRLDFLRERARMFDERFVLQVMEHDKSIGHAIAMRAIGGTVYLFDSDPEFKNALEATDVNFRYMGYSEVVRARKVLLNRSNPKKDQKRKRSPLDGC